MKWIFDRLCTISAERPTRENKAPYASRVRPGLPLLPMCVHLMFRFSISHGVELELSGMNMKKTCCNWRFPRHSACKKEKKKPSSQRSPDWQTLSASPPSPPRIPDKLFAESKLRVARGQPVVLFFAGVRNRPGRLVRQPNQIFHPMIDASLPASRFLGVSCDLLISFLRMLRQPQLH